MIWSKSKEYFIVVVFHNTANLITDFHNSHKFLYSIPIFFQIQGCVFFEYILITSNVARKAIIIHENEELDRM